MEPNSIEKLLIRIWLYGPAVGLVVMSALVNMRDGIALHWIGQSICVLIALVMAYYVRQFEKIDSTLPSRSDVAGIIVAGISMLVFQTVTNWMQHKEDWHFGIFSGLALWIFFGPLFVMMIKFREKRRKMNAS